VAQWHCGSVSTWRSPVRFLSWFFFLFFQNIFCIVEKTASAAEAVFLEKPSSPDTTANTRRRRLLPSSQSSSLLRIRQKTEEGPSSPPPIFSSGRLFIVVHVELFQSTRIGSACYYVHQQAPTTGPHGTCLAAGACSRGTAEGGPGPRAHPSRSGSSVRLSATPSPIATPPTVVRRDHYCPR
jgi:hypothetical protein